jgi:RHS repeat-associated protein
MRHKTLLKYILAIAGILGTTGSSAQNKPNGSIPPVVSSGTTLPAYSISLGNYIRTWVPSMPTTDPNAIINATSVSAVQQTTDYFDGMGNPLQTVMKGISPAGKDLVTTFVFDKFGRQVIDYLPYAAQNGNTTDGKFKIDPFSDQKNFYKSATLNPGVAGDSVYYDETTYESSPLNRLLKKYSAGNSWAKLGGNRPVQVIYDVNTTQDSVRIWRLLSSGSIPTSGSTDIYPAGTLQKVITIDENGKQTISYTDKEGRLIMKKAQLSSTPGTAHIGWLCTYFVYDEIGNQRYIIPPLAVDKIKGNWVITSQIAYNLCTIFQYDARLRMIYQKMPGADTTDMVYDKRDRLILYRKGIEKGRQQWLINYYDSINRPRINGLFVFGFDRPSMQAYIDGSAFTPSNTGPFSETAIQVLTYTYYDKYTYTSKQDYVNTDRAKLEAGSNPYSEPLPSTPSAKTKGQITGVTARIEYTSNFLTTSFYYDDKSRTIQTVATNYPGGKDITYHLYDFSGKKLATYVNHTNPKCTPKPNTRILTLFHYDAAGRMDSIKKRLDDNVTNQVTLAVMTYDELGRLKTKRLHPTGPATQIETLTYDYNIRGWQTGINKNYVNTAGSTSNWFGEDISYNVGFDSSEYNGNVSGIKWKGRSDGISRAYGFDYDNAARLSYASFTQQNSGSTTWTNNLVDFSTTGLTYDLNGNILSDKKTGMNGPVIQTIDSLQEIYATNSNQLLAVTDKKNDPSSILGDFKETVNNTSTDYTYDPNGNIAMDKNKGIDSFYFNHQNHLAIVYAKNKQAQLYFEYLATGERLSKIIQDPVASPVVSDVYTYIGDLVYKNDTTLLYITTEEGRIRPIYKSGQTPNFSAYEYFVKDHLGNIRATLTNNKDTGQYVLTMETSASAVENQLFSNVDNTRIARPAGSPQDNTTNPNDYVAVTNANAQKVGPALTLRVMSGDSVTIVGKGFYKNAGAITSSATSTSMVSSALQAYSNTGVAQGVHVGTGPGAPINMLTSTLYDFLKNKDANQNQSSQPKAYLTFILFDDRFNMVDANSGVRQLQGPTDSLLSMVVPKMTINKTGYLYIYVCNESAQNVYFDNLIITHLTGPLQEENHYYPFGLQMAGISSAALKPNNYPENPFKFNGLEYDKTFDLNNYEAALRNYDPQIGRWTGLDPKQNVNSSPYVGLNDNPIIFNDMLGDTVHYVNDAARELIEKFTQQTIVKKNGKTVDNPNYNAAFAAIISKLDESQDNFNFKFDAEATEGSTNFDGKDVNITIADVGDKYGNKKGGGAAGILFEETKHAQQILDGKVTFQWDETAKKWDTNTSILNEIEAKLFVADQLGVNAHFRTQNSQGNDIWVPTMLYYLTKTAGDDLGKANYLIKGAQFKVLDDKQQQQTVTQPGAYPYMRYQPVLNTLDKRTKNDKVFGYPDPRVTH